MDSVQKKILDLASENQIRKFSQFSDAYSSCLKKLSKDFAGGDHHPSALLKTVIGYGEICEFDLLSGTVAQNVPKAALVFYHLLDEAQRLLNELKETLDRFLEIDSEIDEFDNSNLDVSIGMLSDHFLFLCRAARLIMRVIECSRCIVEQCVGGVLIAYPKGDVPISLPIVVEQLSSIMRQIETWDEIINASKLKFLWLVFKGKVFNHFQMIENELSGSAKGVSSFIDELDQFFAGNFYEIFLTEINSTKGVAQKDSLLLFSTIILNIIKEQIKEAQKYKSELSDYLETDNLISITLLVVFSFNYFGNINNSSAVFKQLVSLTGRHCAVSILPNVLWRPEVFIARHADQLIGKQWASYSKNIQNQRKLFMQGKLANLQKTVNSLSFQVILIIFEINTVFGGSKKLKTPEDLHNAIGVLRKYFSLSGLLRCFITTMINLHVVLELDLPRNSLIAIGKLVELLVSMRCSITGHAKGILFNMQTAQELYLFKLLTTIDSLRKKMIKSGLRDSRKLDAFSVLQTAEKCANGTLTKKRLMVLRLINTENLQQQIANEGDISLNGLIEDLQLCMDPMVVSEALMDTSFLFCNRSIFKVYLKNYLLQLEDPARLTNFVTAITHSSKRPQAMVTLFRDTLKTELVQKLSREIENRLRLDFHKKLNKNSEPLNTILVRDPRGILELEPLKAFDEYYEVKGHIEAELSHTFYNLITVSPHDWRTYGEMRNLAGSCFALETVPDGLPIKTVDQACDIMDILMDLSVFVNRFCYDMNEQVFTEKSSPNKHLNAILVSHVAQSIQTHGIGIINTTVNVTYQFLKKKFSVFSQLLYDEHVKSRLIRDQRIVTDRIMNKSNPVYPLEAGANLIKHLRSVFAASNRASYMDGLRDLLIEIGNALGLVRSMRSGRLLMGANSLEHFNWSDSEFKSYGELFKDQTEPQFKEAASNLDAAIESLEDNFSESADYLKMLVNAFKKHIRSDKFAHLHKFYLIVPALTMNYVEYIIILKEDLVGLPRSRCHQFTDDGFTIGLVYLLTVLDQVGDFNSLHWFATVDKYYTEQVNKLNSQTAEAGIDQEKIMQTRSLSEKRFRSLQREFNFLYFNLSSSKIFFQ